MSYKEFNIILNLDGTGFVDMPKPVQGESGVKMKFALIGNSMPINLSDKLMIISFKKPDKTESHLSCIIDDAESGRAHVILTNQVLALAGKVQAQIKLVGESVIKSWIFNILVMPSLSDNAMESSNEFKALEDALLTVNQYESRISNVELGINDLAGTGRTVETVKGNADNIDSLEASVGDNTIDDTLVPSTDTGLSVKILLSWLANMIKSITGKASWRIKPTKNLEQLNTAIDEHKADRMPHQIKNLKTGKTYQYGYQVSINGIPQVISEEVI